MGSPHPWFWSLQLLPTFGIDPPLLPSLSLPFPCPIATCLRFLLPSFPPSFLPSPRYESYFSPPPPLLSLSLSLSPSSIVSVRGAAEQKAATGQSFFPSQSSSFLPSFLPSFFPSISPFQSLAGSRQPSPMICLKSRAADGHIKNAWGGRANAAVSACVTKSELRILIK